MVVLHLLQPLRHQSLTDLQTLHFHFWCARRTEKLNQ